MITESIPMQEVFELLDQTFFELSCILQTQTERTLNTVPFECSWTAAEVADHITKSTRSIAKAMQMVAPHDERDPDKKIAELKKIFLDFTVRYNSPEFILPDKKHYEKETLIFDLLAAHKQLKEKAGAFNLAEIIKHPAFGEITKLELLYFVLFHTQRHLRQVKNIIATISRQNRY